MRLSNATVERSNVKDPTIKYSSSNTTKESVSKSFKIQCYKHVQTEKKIKLIGIQRQVAAIKITQLKTVNFL